MQTAAGLSETFTDLTGGKRVKMAWTREANAEGNHPFGKANVFQLVTYDSADDTIRVLLDTLDDYTKPLITADGSRIVFSDRVDRRIDVVRWDGSGRETLAAGFAGAVWRDPSSGKEWVYFQDRFDGDNSSRRIKRLNLNNPREVELVWQGSQTNMLWGSISSDGKRIGGSWPWKTTGVIAPDYRGGGRGEFYASSNGCYQQGCWASLTPDSTYRFAVFDDAHRNWLVWDSPTGAKRMVTLNSAPGIDGWEIYHPKFSNHPQFIVLTGPYSIGPMGGNNIGAGGPQVDVYFGKVDSGFTAVTDWVRITSDSQANFFPTAWIDNGVRPSVQIDRFTAMPTTATPGATVTLDWATTAATSASIMPYPGAVSTSGSVQVRVSETTTFTLTAEGPSGPTTRTVAVNVPLRLRLAGKFRRIQ